MIIVDDDAAVAVFTAAAALCRRQSNVAQTNCRTLDTCKNSALCQLLLLAKLFFLRRAQFHAQEAVYLHIYAKLPSSRPPGYSLLGIVLLMSEFLLIIGWRRVVQRQLIKRSQRKGTKRCSSVSLPAVKCACAVYTLVAGQRVSMQSVTLASSVKNASGAPHNIPTRNWVSVALICGANNGVEKWRCGLIASFLSGSFAAISATCVQVCS